MIRRLVNLKLSKFDEENYKILLFGKCLYTNYKAFTGSIYYGVKMDLSLLKDTYNFLKNYVISNINNNIKIADAKMIYYPDIMFEPKEHKMDKLLGKENDYYLKKSYNKIFRPILVYPNVNNDMFLKYFTFLKGETNDFVSYYCYNI